MPKRIIDIFPPDSFSRSSQFEQLKREVLSIGGRDRGRDDSGKNIRTKILISSFLFLILTLGSLHFFFSRIEIIIWPKTEIFNTQERIIIDANSKEVDIENQVIPGIIFQAEPRVSINLQAKGVSTKKAEGIIRLYNSFTTRPETWLQGTRFVSSEGKLFLSKDRIQVPGAVIRNGKVTPASVDVPVIAAQEGEDYNIGPSNFSIAAFRGTPRFTSYYGESLASMAGGGTFPRVTSNDLEEAKNALIEKAKESSARDFVAKVPPGFVFLSQAQEIEILESDSSAQEGAEVGDFKYELLARSRVMAFDSKDIMSVVKSMIASRIPPQKALNQDSVKIEYQEEFVDLKLGRMAILLNISAKIYQEVEFDDLKKALAGKSLSEAEVLLENQSENERFKINLFPFWLRSVPERLDKIEVKLSID